jgi:hypothetical protein
MSLRTGRQRQPQWLALNGTDFQNQSAIHHLCSSCLHLWLHFRLPSALSVFSVASVLEFSDIIHKLRRLPFASGLAVNGSSGHECFGYLTRKSLRT